MAYQGKPPSRPHETAKGYKKKGWKGVSFARVHILSSFNNVMVTIADDKGNVLVWGSAGSTGFKGTKKGTPFAAQMTANRVGKRAAEMGIRDVVVFVKGPGPARETAIRALQGAGLRIVSLRDETPLPHNGCRPPKQRRV